MEKKTWGPVTAASRIAAVMMVCLVAVALLPAVASATWGAGYPVTTLHRSPAIVGIDWVGAALDARTASISIDNGVGAVDAHVTVGTNEGSWTSEEVEVSTGYYRVKWNFGGVGAGAKTTIYGFPSSLATGTYTVTVSADTAAGAPLTTTFAFTVAANGTEPPAPPADDVIDSGCVTCHFAGSTLAGAFGADYVNDNAMGADCASCHSDAFEPGHGIRGAHTPSTDTGCALCHDTDLPSAHAAVGVGCGGCHGNPAMADHVTAGDTNCTSCHDATDAHGATHDGNADYSAMVQGQVSFIYSRTDGGPWHDAYTRTTCTSCHRSSNLVTVHLGSNSCPICHGTGGPRSSFASWDKSCMQGACHTPTEFYVGMGTWSGTPFIQHDDAAAAASHMTEAVTGLDAQGFCLNECHTRGCAAECHTVKDGTVDTSAPITRSSQVSSSPITWQLSPVDSQSGVESTFYSFDGAPFAPYGPDEAANGISNGLDSIRVGQHTLQCYSVDASGNTEATRTINYVTTGTDLTPPVIALNGVRTGPNSVVATSATLSVRDPKDPSPCSGLASVRVSYKSYDRFWGYTFGNIYWYPVNYTIPTSAWDTTSTFGRLEDQARNGFGGGTVSAGAAGNYFVIRYYAVDHAGNTSVQMEDSVFLDNVAPSTTAAKVSGVERWRLTASDNAVPVASTYYRFDAGSFAPYTAADASTGVANTEPGGDASGSHTLRYYSVDALGNSEIVKSLTYSVP